MLFANSVSPAPAVHGVPGKETMDVKERMDWLVGEINRNDELYYVQARPAISDAQYDALFEELAALEREYPLFANPDSPTRRVSGAPQTGFAQVRHDPPMKSLDKCYAKEDLLKFDAFLDKEAPAARHYVVEPKIDGVSMSLLYSQGRLVRAATRGNGEVGDDVTRNVKTIASIPKTLPPDAPRELEVRGEVYMTREGFAALNAELDEAGKDTFMNPRNACAGSLKLLDPAQVAKRPLAMVVYNAGGKGCDGFATHSEMMKAFASWGLPVSPYSRVVDDMAGAIAAIDELGGMRHSFPFEIDGAVVKIEERSMYGSLGATAHSPRWARAYKYAPERVETKVLDIVVQVGRTGVLTPVAVLEPVEIAGSVVSRATLHNRERIAAQDIRIGDAVWLVKAGDIIPAIDGVLKEKRDASSAPFVFPDKCPVCGGEVGSDEGEVAVRCRNPLCPAQLQRRLEHFAARNALDIGSLGGRVSDVLVEKKIVRDVLDVFTLDPLELSRLDVGEGDSHRVFGKNAETLCKAAEAAKSLPLERWLFAIGIPNVGQQVAKDIAAAHARMSDLAGSEVLKEVLENDARKGRDRKILPIKVEAAKAVLAFFDSPYGKAFMERMRALGIDPEGGGASSKGGDGPLKGVSFVLTGALSRPRPEYARMIEEAGGTVQSSVSSKTRYLVAGENVGASKTAKAAKFGTEVIDEAKLKELLSSGAEKEQGDVR